LKQHKDDNRMKVPQISHFTHASTDVFRMTL